MKQRIRCRIGLHKWVIMQDSSDAPRYYGCRYCDKMSDFDGGPTVPRIVGG